jgi:predicted metal-dependent peptidase
MLSKEDYTYSPPNRRYLAQDIYVPSLRSRTVGVLVVSVDSSASITIKALQVWGNEVAKLSSIVEECVVLVSDTTVHQVIKTRDIPAFLKSLKFKGRGGTDHRPVFEKIRELRLSPDLFIGLTDGATVYPEIRPSYPVLWCLTAEGHSMRSWRILLPYHSYVTSEAHAR